MTTKRDLELIYEIGCLRFLQRNWKQFLNADFQNITEHTFRVMWISLILAKYEGVNNTEKIIKMALVHDFDESRTGDTQYISRLYNKQFSEKAINDIFENTCLAEEFINLWREYEKRECIEAKIVKDADNLDVELELEEQRAKGFKLRDEWKANRKQIVFNKLFTKSAKDFWLEIEKSNPHDWHMNARNRFTKGDWKIE